MSCNDMFKYITADEYCLKVTDGTHDSPKRVDEGRYLITSKHIKGRNINYNDAYFISEDDYNKINLRSKVDQWDVLISMIGAYCGFCYVERNNNIDYAVKNVGILKTGDKLKAEWLYYYLNSNQGKNYLDTVRAGSTQPYLSLGELRKIPIPVPENIEEMKKIVLILSVLDEKIELNNEMNKTLEEMAQALFKRWFVDFEFPNEEGKPYKSSGGEMVESELGMIPKGWNISTLNDVCMKITDGSHYSPKNCVDGIYPMLSVKDMQDYCFDYKSCKKIGEEDFKKMLNSDCVPKVNDIVIAKDGSYLKHVFIINKDKKEAILSSIAIFRANVEKIYPEVLLWLLKNPLLQKIVKENYVSGSALPRIVLKDFRRLKIVVPPLEVQKSIVNLFLEIRKQIDINTENNKNLSDIRNILLPKLMSGEIRVDNVETDI